MYFQVTNTLSPMICFPWNRHKSSSSKRYKTRVFTLLDTTLAYIYFRSGLYPVVWSEFASGDQSERRNIHPFARQLRVWLLARTDAKHCTPIVMQGWHRAGLDRDEVNWSVTIALQRIDDLKEFHWISLVIVAYSQTKIMLGIVVALVGW